MVVWQLLSHFPPALSHEGRTHERHLAGGLPIAPFPPSFPIIDQHSSLHYGSPFSGHSGRGEWFLIEPVPISCSSSPIRSPGLLPIFGKLSLRQARFLTPFFFLVMDVDASARLSPDAAFCPLAFTRTATWALNKAGGGHPCLCATNQLSLPPLGEFSPK